ncbi:MerR family transcriptional regulator [Ihubacter massiliensis]|uniref:MerR family transcriptional regulator n=1 Tax=Hominibacterium faecale TaxID=2839743 RepID=A0A9J6QLA2_9FIRM|nr:MULTISPECIES: MerR family transcriptional regulator [Eubacteriales Family XIII. Incertae Sedis]MCI7300885.1 MerR family transcriptional regulator [Clostridia bacterium]MDE8732488.1 MerR family transcriptional regulator [Eubacteriales bacterium DFI.9.88]MDY3012771.1 MerR family transcriptional regulator [Clostridiales Family XIII bacterium]MCO7121278.1 MerR family transcriptional regulator [Ihubacter massiliensis]MCU7378264.1 MerR family transcriptional regulator [Hominibacterium faecale]
MSNQKNTLFTIGQFADLHQINKKTLMWYDEVDIFKPAVIKENGYRCYTYDQSTTLETILMLRKLDVSIPEIREFINARSAAALRDLFAEKIAELDQTIAHMKAMRKTLTDRQETMSRLVDLDLSEISIIEKKASCLAVVHMEKGTPLEAEIKRVIEEAKKYSFQRLHDAQYGSMIEVEKLYQGNFDDYFAFFINLPDPGTGKGLHVQPKGRYLKAFCKGSWEKLPVRYQEILQYAKDHGLTLRGYAYERGINEIVIDTIDDYITQIEIPIME